MRNKVTIVGAGGIGCALGHALRVGDVDVTVVEVDSAKLAWGHSNGVAVDALPPRAAEFTDWPGGLKRRACHRDASGSTRSAPLRAEPDLNLDGCQARRLNPLPHPILLPAKT